MAAAIPGERNACRDFISGCCLATSDTCLQVKAFIRDSGLIHPVRGPVAGLLFVGLAVWAPAPVTMMFVSTIVSMTAARRVTMDQNNRPNPVAVRKWQMGATMGTGIGATAAYGLLGGCGVAAMVYVAGEIVCSQDG